MNESRSATLSRRATEILRSVVGLQATPIAAQASLNIRRMSGDAFVKK
jgi:hypothetical protein